MQMKRGLTGYAGIAIILCIAAGVAYAFTGICPKCHRTDAVVPIEYGLLNHHGMELAQQGKIHMGGCEVTGIPFIDKSRYCNRCKISF